MHAMVSDFGDGGIFCDKQKMSQKNQDSLGIHINMLIYNVEV